MKCHQHRPLMKKVIQGFRRPDKETPKTVELVVESEFPDYESSGPNYSRETVMVCRDCGALFMDPT